MGKVFAFPKAGRAPMNCYKCKADEIADVELFPDGSVRTTRDVRKGELCSVSPQAWAKLMAERATNSPTEEVKG